LERKWRRLGKISLTEENARSRVKRVNPTLRMRHIVFTSMIGDRLWFYFDFSSGFEMIRRFRCLFEARTCHGEREEEKRKFFSVCKASAKEELEKTSSRDQDNCCKPLNLQASSSLIVQALCNCSNTQGQIVNLTRLTQSNVKTHLQASTTPTQ
jgi:hypothetical protein